MCPSEGHQRCHRSRLPCVHRIPWVRAALRALKHQPATNAKVIINTVKFQQWAYSMEILVVCREAKVLLKQENPNAYLNVFLSIIPSTTGVRCRDCNLQFMRRNEDLITFQVKKNSFKCQQTHKSIQIAKWKNISNSTHPRSPTQKPKP